MTHREKLPAHRDRPFGAEETQRASLAQLFHSSQQQLLPEGRKLRVTEELLGGAEEEETPPAQRRFAGRQEYAGASPSK